MFNLIIGGSLAFLIHESAHYLTALAFGYRLKFRRQGLRYIWDMPDTDKWKQRCIALSGFGAEVLAVPLLYLVGLTAYPYVVAVHLVAYNFYAKEYSDFKWL